MNINEKTKLKPFLVLGNLSNTLIKDEGFKGVGIKLMGDFANVKISRNYMLVGAAVLDINLSKLCYQKGY